MAIIHGRALVLGDDVSTDVLQPSRYFSLDAGTRAAGVLAGQDSPPVAGAIIVAGRNFGAGSSREAVIRGMKEAGVRGVAARSLSRIFLRNAINHGLPVFAGLDESSGLAEGDEVVLDPSVPCLRTPDGTPSWPLDGLDAHLAAILEAGGLLPFLGLPCAK